MVWFADPERFAADQLAALVTEATGGDLHTVLAPQAVWLDDVERARAKRALEDLAAQYAGEPVNGNEPAFTDVAELLTRPPEARFGWFSDLVSSTRLRVLVAGSRWFSLVAVGEGDDIFVRTFDEERLAVALASILPAGAGRAGRAPISVLASEYREAAHDTAALPRAEVRRAQRFAELEPSMIAELYVEARRPDGHHTISEPLRVYDTEQGRWLFTTSPEYGDERLTLAPATTMDVVAALDALRNSMD
ncbi:ESX secretion-associated protein EspG [Amycolatopsis sp. NPDC059021]|uniref:ESX secretion-associated protein EspG n=1 Tax=Amycolatopsis sp. NPDC059021 TaxID=3346704 RepID=UPI0036706D17